MIDAMTEAVAACGEDDERLCDLTTDLAVALAADNGLMSVVCSALVATLSGPCIGDAEADRVLEKLAQSVTIGRAMMQCEGRA